VRPASPAPAAVAAAGKKRNGLRRFVLLVVLPAIAVVGGVAWWLSGGRYVSTDNAYVGADKALITPYVTGPIVAVHVKEGQHVKAGDPLFDIDPAPYETALALAKGRLAAAKVEFSNLRDTYASNIDQIRMGEDSVRLRQADFDRKKTLASTHAGTLVEQDTSAAALVQAKQILEFVKAQQETVKVKLGGGPDTRIEDFPAYMQAKAGVDDANRNLGYTHVRAPIDGVATQVANIELGRVAPAGQAVFAVVSDKGLWVDANPKESDLTYVTRGLPATATVDAFPGREWKGHVCSIAPGTGAQFAILPPQNASGNWVKVVQRVPLRFCFDADQDTTGLRAGMSTIVSIDTGRVRSLAGLKDDLLGWLRSFVAPAKAEAAAQ
jgi:membrane fusion protein (multidrug efflux system)